MLTFFLSPWTFFVRFKWDFSCKIENWSELIVACYFTATLWGPAQYHKDEGAARVGAIGNFIYHILTMRYDTEIQKNYHIEFYHILEFLKSLSYYVLSYYQKMQKLYHISFIIFSYDKEIFSDFFELCRHLKRRKINTGFVVQVYSCVANFRLLYTAWAAG